MQTDGARLVHHLPWLTHVGGAKVKNDVWKRRQVNDFCFKVSFWKLIFLFQGTFFVSMPDILGKQLEYNIQPSSCIILLEWEYIMDQHNCKTNSSYITGDDWSLMCWWYTISCYKVTQMFCSSDSCFFRKLTQNKKHFHCDVANYGAPACSLQIAVRCETHIVRHGHSNIECSQQNHPIPQCLGHTVMQQDESRLLDCCHFVLRQGRFFKYVLRWERRPQMSSHISTSVNQLWN